MDKFGDRLKKLRKEKKFTQVELGKMLKTSHATINRYEKNIHQPDIDTINKIANIFNVSTDYLLCRTNNRQEYQLTDEEADQLADEIIEIYIKKGKIKRGEVLTPEKREKILKEIDAFIDMTNKLEGN